MFKYLYQYKNVYHNHIIHFCVEIVKIIIKIGGVNMENDEKLNELVAEMKRENARLWRKNNKDKVREINKRYWLKKAKKKLAEENKKEEE